jgi:hypothetical protein
MVFDLDSDGKAELVCKTAPGTMDASGAYLSKGPAAADDDSADYRNTAGYILSGPEYLTVFNGLSGKEMATVNYNPPRGTVSSWGDNYGNRVDRFLACVAYLDGVHPSVVMCRGYYTRMVLAAWDWNGSALTQRWVFDSNNAGNAAYYGMGNHNLSVADVDSDGKDEIIYGASAFDHDGKGMYTTGLGHGDAMHLGKFDPDRAGLQVWEIHENYPITNGGGELHDAATGQIIWGIPNTGDTGRGMAADVDANHRGAEMWSPMTAGVDDVTGASISAATPSENFRIYWDGDLQDELLDGTKLDKWNGNGTGRLLTVYNYAGATANNGTKANPGLTADILGDWREEMVYRNADSSNLIIFTTTTMTNYRFYTLMHDFEYRDSIAWQNTAYNQPPHVSFYLGDGPSAQPVEDIIYPGAAPLLTPTNSPVSILTPSFTATQSATRTATVSITATKTAVQTATITLTSTRVIFSPTHTLTLTVSSTQTSTMTVPVPSPIFTAINTAATIETATPQETAIITRTATAVNTASPVNSATSTNTCYCATATWTPTNNMTNTITNTPTTAISMTNTFTPQPTTSYTATKTNTAQLTAANTVTLTFTFTLTVMANTPTTTITPVNAPVNTATPVELEITGTNIYPNPYNYRGGDLYAGFFINKGVTSVTLTIYTTAFRLVYKKSDKLTRTAGLNYFTVQSQEMTRFAAGPYYFVITASNGSDAAIRSKIRVFIVFK